MENNWYAEHGFYGWVTVEDDTIGEIYTWHPDTAEAFVDCIKEATSKTWLLLIDYGVYGPINQ